MEPSNRLGCGLAYEQVLQLRRTEWGLTRIHVVMASSDYRADHSKIPDPTDYTETSLAQPPNYRQQKKQRELVKKKKNEEKRQRKEKPPTETEQERSV